MTSARSDFNYYVNWMGTVTPRVCHWQFDELCLQTAKMKKGNVRKLQMWKDGKFNGFDEDMKPLPLN